MLSASFNLPPFDLGTFDEIVHRVRGRTKPDAFSLEFENVITLDPRRLPFYISREAIEKSSGLAKVRLTFSDNVGDAAISTLRLDYGEYSLQVSVNLDIRVVVTKGESVIFESSESQGAFQISSRIGRVERLDMSGILFYLWRMVRDSALPKGEPIGDMEHGLAMTAMALEQLTRTFPSTIFACAPVRSSPSRVYTPTDQLRSPDGTHTPQTLFKIKEADEKRWLRIKAGLEEFGRQSGMFSKINVARYRSSGSSPFQINVTRKGKQSNIVDVGYGVSQALPILTDLIESPPRSGFLFQQPEVHLHPQAQAALGTFFVDYLERSSHATIVAETHSDYLIDRVRLCVRNKKIRPSDVTILYFESVGTDALVHQINIDTEGNIQNVPDGYRKFFVREQMTLLGLSD